MEKQTLFFIAVFVLTLSFLSFFAGQSITGHFGKTMYCKDSVCKTFCTADADCIGDRECCDVKGMGICDDMCIAKYVFGPPVESLPNYENPARTDNGLGAFLLLLTVATIIGLLYSMRE